MWELRVLHSDWLYNLEMGGTLTLVFVLQNQGGLNHSNDIFLRLILVVCL